MKIIDKIHKIDIVEKGTPVKDVSKIIRNDTPDAFIVMDQGQVIGILTDSDLIMKVKKKDLNSTSIKVEEVMSSPVVFIDVNKDIKDAIDLMVKNNIQKLLVIENDQSIGIIYGEEILDLDEKKWKDLLLNQTIEEVYKLLIREPELDFSSVYNVITDMDKFTDMESKVEFDLYVYQEGIVLVAYNYIKEKGDIPLDQIKIDIKKNYPKLLDKYSKEE